VLGEKAARLPFTGFDSTLWLLLGVATLGAGLVLIAATRTPYQRRH
jgi:hypothetical protein